ncbi:hypothetical protein SAMD00019534_026000 [Acytostelium subglobosum LB1]|uniref:hypothetical protein n=1 Tax=Acytostelium subglobosum LB1 TaxID=1410327 RepID=UPI0006449314|nr:hypothetical protein SAMD00019534_026000 [Acytostelium subglobosum LB1]GAM19425.1 hypothetical protein SAMD00019534_026000 [Acytostelium subglobosum LB1]|eukprot:XP_012757352.1 hypothetical protein SAMD00019534_026000 [Acytostelium subglobosum LB1]
MTSVEFLIPIHYEDLESASHNVNDDDDDSGDTTTDKYTIRKQINVLELSDNTKLKTLDDIHSRLTRDTLDILNHNNFDPLFYFIGKIPSLPNDVKNQVLSILQTGLTKIHPVIQDLISKSSSMNHGSDDYTVHLQQVRNSLKIYVFFIQWFNHFSTNDKSVSASSGAGASGSSGATTANSKKRKTSKQTGVEEIHWEQEGSKERTLTLLHSLLELNLAQLWKLDCPEEAFVQMITRMVYAMIENQANIRSKPIKQTLFAIIIILVQRYNHAQMITDNVVRLLNAHEHLPQHMAELYGAITSVSEGDKHTHLVADAVREIGKITSRDLHDNAGVRHMSEFIGLLASNVPGLMQPLLPSLLLQLDNENYAVRNGVIDSVGHLIEHVHKNKEAPNRKTTLDSLFQTLFDRYRDVNPYSRNKVLQTLLSLLPKHLVPPRHYRHVVEIAIGRISDKVSWTRKYAMQLFKATLKHQYYSAVLRSDFFEQLNEKFHRLENDLLEQDQGSQMVDDNDDEALEQDDQGDDEEGKKKPMFANIQSLKIDKAQLQDLVENTPYVSTVDFPPSKWISTVFPKMKSWIVETTKFIKLIEQPMDTICMLLGSVNNSDVLEAIKVILKAYKLGISNSKQALSKMLVLIWSKEQPIKEATIDAFNKIIVPNDSDHSPKEPYLIAKRLIDLTFGMTLGEMTSLEELVKEMMKKQFLKPSVIHALWDIFSGKVQQYNSSEDIRGALIVLSMAANVDHNIVAERVNLLVTNGLESNKNDDEYVPRYTCITLQKLRSEEGVTSSKMPRIKNDQVIFEKLIDHMLQQPTSQSRWLMFAEQAINTIYTLSEQPEALSAKILKKLIAQINQQTLETVDSQLLSRFIFILGHIALKQLVHIEEIRGELRKQRIEKNNNQAKSSKKSQQENIEKELGSEQAEAENEEDKLQEKAERDIIMENNLIGRYVPLIQAICINQGNNFNDQTLQTTAVLTLCKLMCVNSEFCDNNLQIIFTLLASSQSETIRSNIVICLGDLAVRFPNVIEPWTLKLYARLRDKDVSTRNTTLMVLTHLILNDMVKVKVSISELALCLVDTDQRIVYNARLFFNSLSSKGNTLYNILPEVISRLAIDSGVNVTNESIRDILKYLFSFIQKEKLNENLVEKMCHRFKIAKDIAESRNIAFCLQLLSYSEKSLRKLLDSYKVYQDKLVDEEVSQLMSAIITKAKKGVGAKPAEWKQLIDELERKLTIHTENEDDQSPSVAAPSTGTQASRPKRAVTKAKTKAKAKSKKDDDDDDDDEDEEESSDQSMADDEEDDDDEAVAPSKPTPAVTKAKPPPASRKKPAAAPKKKPAAPAPATRKKPAARRKKPVESESEESEESDEDMDSESSESQSESEDMDSDN